MTSVCIEIMFFTLGYTKIINCICSIVIYLCYFSFTESTKPTTLQLWRQDSATIQRMYDVAKAVGISIETVIFKDRMQLH